MNKKYLSALLFGALTLASTGTFTSCKDYDDDIEDLQNQLNQQNTDLKGKVDAANTAISSLETAQNGLKDQIANAQKAADAAQAAADAAAKVGDQAVKDAAAAAKEAAAAKLAAAEAQKAAIEAAQTALDAATTELKGLIEAAEEANKEEVKTINEKIAAVEAKFNEHLGEVKAIKDAVAANTEGLKELTTKVADVVTRLEAEEAATAELKTAVEELKAKDAELAESIKTTKEALEKADQELSKRIDVLDQKLAENITAVAVLEHEMQLQAATLTLFGEEVTRMFENDAAKIAEVEESVKKAKADLEAKIATDIEAAKTELNKVIETKASKEEVNAAIKLVEDKVTAVEDALKAFKENLKNQVSEFLNGVQNEYREMITSVELVKSEAAFTGTDLKFKSGKIEADYTFMKIGDQLATNYINFEKNGQHQITTSFEVRVSPVDAELTPGMISLVNGNGVNLDEMVVVDKVERIKKELTRGVSNSGLWKVTLKLAKFDARAFNTAAFKDKSEVGYNAAGMLMKGNSPSVDPVNDVKGNRLLYSVQVKNSYKEGTTQRAVASSFDLTLAYENFKALGSLDYVVDGKDVNEIQNRVYSTGLPLTMKYHRELQWIDGAKKLEYDSNGAIKGTKEVWNRYTSAGGDFRMHLTPQLAVQGNDIKIELRTRDNAGKITKAAPDQVKAILVRLDNENAYESDASEKNIWSEYQYKGLNEVVLGTSTTISVDYKTSINDVIGFRVFAVNHDGKLVDPDGKAFYVKIGDAGQVWPVAETSLLAGISKPSEVNSEPIAVTLTGLNSPATATWTTDKFADKSGHVFDIRLLGEDKKTILYSTLSTDSKANVNIDYTKVKFIQTVGVDHQIGGKNEWLSYEDNKAYNGKLVISNAEGFVLATLNASMTKVLPVGMPKGYSLRDKQVINGIYNCFMIPGNAPTIDENGIIDWSSYSPTSVWSAFGTTAAYGHMAIKNLINFHGDSNGEGYEVEFADSRYDGKDKRFETQTAPGNKYVSVDAKLIDNATEYNTAIFFNYGKISTETKDANGAIIDYKQPGETFKTVYSSFYHESVQTWKWADNEELNVLYPNSGWNDKVSDAADAAYKKALPYTLTYATAPTQDFSWYILGKNTVDGHFSTTLTNNKTQRGLKPVFKESLKVVGGTLVSDANMKSDYFKVVTDGATNIVTLEPLQTADNVDSNPKENVPSTLTLNCVDSYGKKVTIVLHMTVKPL